MAVHIQNIFITAIWTLFYTSSGEEEGRGHHIPQDEKREGPTHTHTHKLHEGIYYTHKCLWLEGRLEAENKRLFFLFKKKKKDITHRVHGQQLLPAVERFFSHAAVASYPILSLPFAKQESVYVCVCFYYYRAQRELEKSASTTLFYLETSLSVCVCFPSVHKNKRLQQRRERNRLPPALHTIPLRH